jgi:hypothetical protein
LYFRKVFFDLIVEMQPFISGMETLEEAVSSFLHLCFVANIVYPVGSGILCTFLQRCVAKLDEHGTTAAMRKKDQAAKEDKALRPFKKVFDEFRQKMFDILSSQ